MVSMTAMMMIGTVVSTAMSVMGSIQQGKAAKATADYNQGVALRNQRVSENDAARTRMTAQENAKRADRELRKRRGTAITRGGAYLSFDAFESMALDDELEVASILQAGEQTAQQQIRQGQLSAADGRLAMFKGETAQSQAKTSAAGALFGGAATFAKQNMALPAGSPLKLSA
ncbi:MAG: hypothetical protein ABGX63_02040 [bacterium]